MLLNNIYIDQHHFIRQKLSFKFSSNTRFIEKNLEYSPNKSEYLEAAETLQSSTEPEKIKSAITKLEEMTTEIGKTVMYNGISQAIIEIIKNTLG